MARARGTYCVIVVRGAITRPVAAVVRCCFAVVVFGTNARASAHRPVPVARRHFVAPAARRASRDNSRVRVVPARESFALVVRPPVVPTCLSNVLVKRARRTCSSRSAVLPRVRVPRVRSGGREVTYVPAVTTVFRARPVRRDRRRSHFVSRHWCSRAGPPSTGPAANRLSVGPPPRFEFTVPRVHDRHGSWAGETPFWNSERTLRAEISGRFRTYVPRWRMSRRSEFPVNGTNWCARTVPSVPG